MVEQIFATPLSRSFLGLDDATRSDLRARALKAYEAMNTDRKPWGRNTRMSLENFDPAFAPLFQAVKTRTEAEFGVSVASITGRELVQFKGDFVPPHIESSTLSAVYWIAGEAKPDPDRQEYDGSLVLQHPAGGFGSKALPSDMRVRMVRPTVDLLLIFPSHLLHFGHVYQGENPSVEVHFEMELT